MTKHKWKRASAGAYRAGDFEVTGKGTHWDLKRVSTGEMLAEDLSSKKACQEAADDEPARVKLAPKAESSVSEITMLRQEVSSLACAVEHLAVMIDLLRKSLTSR